MNFKYVKGGSMVEHGGKIIGGIWRETRWCAVCNMYHGSLYECEHYPQEIKEEIRQEAEQSVSPEVEAFLVEIRDVCRKYKFNMWASDSYTIVVDNLEPEEEPIPFDDIEDYTNL